MLEYPELGMEAVWRIEVEDFPAFVVVDDKGNDVFTTKVIARVPVRRWGDPSDFGGIAVYLASDASKFHTGDQMLIDGGYAVF